MIDESTNRILYVADNLRVMRGIESESIDLIATDPPFNSKRSFNAPLGSRAAKQKFEDRWRWDEVTDEWHDVIAADHPAIKELIEAAVVIEGGSIDRKTGAIDTGRVENSIAAYIAWMAPRLVEMKRILRPTGSLYLHCDPAANSYLRLLLDAVFGRENFRNEIVWQRRYGTSSQVHAATKFGVSNDNILFYAKSAKTTFQTQYSFDDAGYQAYIKKAFRHETPGGRRYRIDNLANPALRPNLMYDYKGYPHPKNGWAISKDKMEQWDKEGRLEFPKKITGRIQRRRFFDELKGKPVQSIWSDIKVIASRSNERTGWATQKPLALYSRIIKASSNEGDLVLDPFCGCATTCVAAEQLRRRWIGIDIDPEAEIVTNDRLRSQTGIMEFIDGNPVAVRKSPPRRADISQMSDAKLRVTLWNNQSRRCANPYCDSTNLRAEDLDLDHRIPKSRGGADDQSNRIGLCGNCNRRKGAKAWGTFLDEGRAKMPHPKVGAD